MRAPKTIIAAVALTAVTGLSLAACGSSSNSSSASSSSSPSAAATPVAALTNLTGQSTAVKLDPTFLSALTSLGVKPAPYGTAKIADGSISFPITGGNATYYTPGTANPYVTGSISHDGSGLTLTAGGTEVRLSNFVVNPGTSMLTGDVAVNGTTAKTGIPLFFLDGTNLQPLDTTSDAGHAILTGTVVKILPDAAALLNSTFKTTGVPDYFTVGVATITLTLPAS